MLDALLSRRALPHGRTARNPVRGRAPERHLDHRRELQPPAPVEPGRLRDVVQLPDGRGDAGARQTIALAKRMEVEEVPEWQAKRTLQRAVQALKRHRDIHFEGREEVKPASIIVTTLAGIAYRGSGDLVDVIAHIVREMPSLVVTRGGVLWLPNPVQPDENSRTGSRPSRGARRRSSSGPSSSSATSARLPSSAASTASFRRWPGCSARSLLGRRTNATELDCA